MPELRARPANVSAWLRERYERPLLVLVVVVALVLVIACVSIANLPLARAAARRHEFSVRLGLGASRWRLARQLLSESLMLSSSGAALGLLVAAWSCRLPVRQLSTPTTTVFLDLSIDGCVGSSRCSPRSSAGSLPCSRRLGSTV